MQKKDMHELCREHMHRYVLVQMQNGESYDGIVEYVDGENVYLAVPIGDGSSSPYGGREELEGNVSEADERQFAPYGYGPGFGPGYGYGFPPYGYGFPRPRPRPRPRRFQRLVLPLASLVALSLLPYYY